MPKRQTVDLEKEVPHILVIRLSAMGDVAMTNPVIRTFRASYPEVKITVLTRKFFEPIFSDIDGIQVYYADVDGAHKGVSGLFKLASSLRELGISAVADLHNVLRSNVLKSFFRLWSIQVVQIDKGRKEKKALTRSKNKIRKPLKATHQRYVDVFSRLGYPIDLSTHIFPTRQSLNPRILGWAPNSNKKWLGIAPFAQYQSKVYPLELINEVIQQVIEKKDIDIFLFGGGKKETEILDTISDKYPNVINIAGKLSFADELILINNLDVMLSMDSGNGHLSAMYGVPTITLWGVTHPYAGFVPFGQPLEHSLLPDLTRFPLIPTSIYGNKVPSGYENVMETITPKQVVAKITKVLGI